MIEKKIIKELKKTLGKHKVFNEQEYLLTYSYDASRNEFLPDAVVFPENEQDIKNTLETAFKYRIPVTPRGAGVGLTGGALPVQHGIEIVFTRMNKISTVDTENFLAEVEPGTITYDLQQEVEKKGLFYPPDPASSKTSTIGGNVAENAGGLRCFKYGVTKNYVLGLEAFLVNGDKIKTGGHVLKDVAGYDLKSLLIGSEGTLAVISKIILRLITAPEHRLSFRVDFRSLKKGAEFIQEIIKGRIFPSALEFMDRTSIRVVHDFLGLPLAYDIAASVLIELDGFKIDIAARKEKFLEIVKNFDILAYEFAGTEEEQDKLWHIRRNISPVISKLRPKKINEDIVVPTGSIPDAVEYINKLGAEHHIDMVLFGHFGDGNIHTNLLVDPANEAEMQRAHVVLDLIFRYVIAVKGSITGEHGVGISKKPFMKYQFTPVEIELFKRIKHSFDPHNLLNPGKIF